MNFTDRVRELLTQAGCSINKMLKDLSLGSGTFATWEKNKRIPTGDVLGKIADYFGVTTDYLLGRGEEPAAAPPDPLRDTLLDNYGQLNREGREKLVDASDDLVQTGKYIKSDPSVLGREA